MKNGSIRFEFGEMLMIYRKRAHLSRCALAQRLNVRPETVANYESSRTLPSYSTMSELKKILGEGFNNAMRIVEETDGQFRGRIS